MHEQLARVGIETHEQLAVGLARMHDIFAFCSALHRREIDMRGWVSYMNGDAGRGSTLELLGTHKKIYRCASKLTRSPAWVVATAPPAILPESVE